MQMSWNRSIVCVQFVHCVCWLWLVFICAADWLQFKAISFSSVLRSQRICSWQKENIEREVKPHTYTRMYYTRVFARAKIKCEWNKNRSILRIEACSKALNEQKMQYHRWNKRRLYRLCSHPSQFHECWLSSWNPLYTIDDDWINRMLSNSLFQCAWNSENEYTNDSGRYFNEKYFWHHLIYRIQPIPQLV